MKVRKSAVFHFSRKADVIDLQVCSRTSKQVKYLKYQRTMQKTVGKNKKLDIQINKARVVIRELQQLKAT